ncbi:hypothetical protein QBE53_06355 [Vallitaleaceae bacterium 9-2]
MNRDERMIDYILRSTEDESDLSIKLIEVEARRYPSARLSIIIKDSRYGIQEVDIWIDVDELKHISNSLECILDSTKSTLQTTSMSPREFQLRITKINNRGYFEIRYEINRHRYVENHLVEDGFYSGFITEYQQIVRLKNKVEKLIDYIIKSDNNVD